MNHIIIMQTITAFNRNDFRKWLKKNQKKEKIVGVIVHKKHTGKPFPSHRELMEEAICFGWIDTTIKKINEETYMRKFQKRNKNSKWSDNTLSYAKMLLSEGKMSKQGLEFYKLGLSKPTHDHGIPKNPDMPEELKKELMKKKNKKAKINFDKFSPSRKRTLHRWILRAKLPETRAKRVREILKLAVERK
jgi:uncharacterized protein YdeI (YjbR/CyaY-like superfamily)